MSKYFFVADIHLEPDEKPITWNNFLSFLDLVQNEKGTLYILGDLFNYWVNNKLIIEKYQPVLEKLEEISKSSSVYILPGNRDFLLRQDVLNCWGIKLLKENHRQKLDGIQVLMTHGDALWDQDKLYKLYRKICWPIFRFLDHFTPAAIGNKIAEKIRNASKKNKYKKPSNYKMHEKLALNYFRDGIDVILCGHVHKAEIKQFTGGKQVISLPAWKSDSGGYCLLSEYKVELRDYS